MRKSKNRSQVSVMMTVAPVQFPTPESPPSDVLTVKIKTLRVTDDPQQYYINVTFVDQLIVSGVIESIPARETAKEKTMLLGHLTYDPSDYKKMSLFCDSPLCAQIRPLKTDEGSQYAESNKIIAKSKDSTHTDFMEISCCNVDIMPLFLGHAKKHVKKRMQPLIEPSVLYQKSWDNLPLLNMTIEITRNTRNWQHHEVLKQGISMKLTFIGAYNMPVPFGKDFVYTAASRMPINEDNDFGIVKFNHGTSVPRHFNSLDFNPKWESLRTNEINFVQADHKCKITLDEIQNEDDIPIRQYLDDPTYSTIWGSFHRGLLLGNANEWLWNHIRDYCWPLEVQVCRETSGYSFMAFLNLCHLLYHGEDTVRIAAPLYWTNSEAMQRSCGCDLMLTPNDKASSAYTSTVKSRPESPDTVPEDITSYMRNTGSDDVNAFVIVEVKLGRPLRKLFIPPVISRLEIDNMLLTMEREEPQRRECTGRGQLDRDWIITVKNAVAALRRVPCYGTTERHSFNRQLSETRTRVELITTFWQEAAVYINNNFVVQEFLQNDDTFEEMLMMAHACLMRRAESTLLGDARSNADHTLRAARQARQIQDVPHAMDLYLRVVLENPRDASSWRELATCLRDVDKDWADVCINKSVVLDPRHPLSLLSKGCMLYKENPDDAELFFVALLSLHPLWATGWVVASAYYIKRELYQVADKILELSQRVVWAGRLDFDTPKSWEHELGDWWEHTPILPGMSPYFDAADLLLRIRSVEMAEVCLSLALCEDGESAAYYHLLALCCRLRGNLKVALCHVRNGIKKFGEISYLRSLEAECGHKLNDTKGASVAFEQAGTFINSYSVLLSLPYRKQRRARDVIVELTRRQPSAYVWMALANDWMKRATTGRSTEAESSIVPSISARACAEACAIQALKWDRKAAKAWALLATLVKPNARRMYCEQMVAASGHSYFVAEKKEFKKNN